MCGIAGFFSLSGFPGTEGLERMTQCIQHRGPDAAGYFFENGLGLGHRRLSIIDLSEQANQPMHSACGRYVMVYNGEVYNFAELAAEIQKEKTGFVFRTHGDSEVLLEAFALWGPSFISKTNGMFAIAIFDRHKKELHLFRDRLGIKPLYVYELKDGILFSSELKSITALSGQLPFHINPQAMQAFLHLGYVPHPHSIYEEVKKFPSGSHAVCKGSTTSYHTYWTPASRISSAVRYDEKEALQQLRQLMESSVKYRMISDVPFGTFLSGGIDSSLVTAVAASVSAEPVKTFSISFPESSRNEASYSREVAARLGTRHHEFEVTEQQGRELIPSLVDIYDEPFSDSSSIPTLLVSGLARKHVTMTLSGDGGDELFMGYGAYQWATRLNDPSFFLLKGLVSKLLGMGSPRYKRVGSLLQRVSAAHLRSHIFSQEQGMFTRREIKSLVLPQWRAPLEVMEHPGPLPRVLSAAELQALFDMNYYLPDDLLVKVDRATMHHSLETRVPLLDYRVVEFALNLSPSLKYKNGQSKYLLKQLLYQYLPPEMFERPKWGFSVPLEKWLRGGLRSYMHDCLSPAQIRKAGLVNPQIVAQYLSRFEKGESQLYNRIWLLMVLHAWAEKQASEVFIK